MSIRPFPPTSPLALLERLLSKLDLSQTQRDSLHRSYGAVTKVLVQSEALKGILHKLELKAQGSVRAGTVVKPSDGAPFDLDVLCWMEFAMPGYTPGQVWMKVWEALGESGVYAPMRRRKDRCVRLEFQDGYHLDITPAIPSAEGEPKLFVPDRKREIWSPSNPIGFCDHWFREIAKELPGSLRNFAANSAFPEGGKMANRQTSVEALPDDSGFAKFPLQRIVQLLKYLRDQTYSFDSKHRPSSILLTTVCGQAYKVVVRRDHSSLTEFVLEMVALIPSFVQRTQEGFVVMNPVDDRENFAERWTQETFDVFTSWVSELTFHLKKLFHTNVEGLDGRIKLFEESIPGVRKYAIADDIGREVRVSHDSKKLGLVAIPGIAASTTKVPPTANFGNP